MADNLLTTKEARTRLKVSRNTLYALIESGDLKAVAVGSQYRVTEAELADYIKRNEVKR